MNDQTETASVGEDAITVEIVVGATDAAGSSNQASTVETENKSAADAQPRETEEVTRQDDKKEEKPEPKTKTARDEPKEQPPTQPVPEEFATLVPPDEALARASPTAEPEREREPERKPMEQPQSKPAPAAASAANSIGRGRMSGDANYQGRVAAHLARYKRFPADARRRHEQGSAVVSFNIDGDGKVTSVKLVRGTGHVPLDREVEAMVQRASPFPPPPGGSARSFTAPVSFSLN